MWRPLADSISRVSALTRGRRALAVPRARGWAEDGPALLQMRVRGADFNCARLAGGLRVRAEAELRTELDAVGDEAVSNAVKAVALANKFLERGSSASLAFTPALVESGGEGSEAARKLVRLSICRELIPPARRSEEPEGFSHGGIYVSLDAASAGSRARGGGSAEARVATPTELARTILGQWLRFASPEVRSAARARASGAQRNPVAGRKLAPFVVTMGPSALARAVKALAFVCADLGKEHLSQAPALVVVPRFGERSTRDKFTGVEKTTKLTALCLLRAPEGPLP